MNKKRIINIVPFIMTVVIVLYTWYAILTKDYAPTIKHIIALSLIIVNGVLYFFRFKYAILLTGVLLILATFNLLAIFPEIVSSSYFVKIAGVEIATPSIQWKCLLILIFYLIINANWLINLYIDYKHKESE